ncbi:MAG: calcium-binding protein [bacterium]
MRDDTIAYGEAWQRQELAKQCMAAAGFSYAEDVNYPIETIHAIADAQGLQPVFGAPDPSQFNRDYVNSLTVEEGDRYYQTLLGETKTDINAAISSGHDVPAGADPETFAMGGCLGQARDAIPGVWSARRALEAELSEVRSGATASAASAFQGCTAGYGRVAATPDTLEAAAAAGDPTAEAVLDDCWTPWELSYSSMEATLLQPMIARHREYLESLRTQYEAMLEALVNDIGFRTHLGHAAAFSFDALFLEAFDGECATKIVGTPGNDSLTGGPGSDCIDGRGGNDSIFGGGGNDHLIGSAGSDTINGGEGDDVVKGGSGSDSLLGSAGADFVDGGDDSNSCLLDPEDEPSENC